MVKRKKVKRAVSRACSHLFYNADRLKSKYLPLVSERLLESSKTVLIWSSNFATPIPPEYPSQEKKKIPVTHSKLGLPRWEIDLSHNIKTYQQRTEGKTEQLQIRWADGMTNKSVRAPNTLAQRVIIGNLRFFTWLVVHCKTVVARITKLPFRKRRCCVRSKSNH